MVKQCGFRPAGMRRTAGARGKTAARDREEAALATKADFSEEEWKALQKGVTGSGMLVSVSDRDFTDTFGEASALAKYMAGQHQTNESPLIREIAGRKGSGFGMTASVDKVEAETFASLHTALEALQAKAPDDVEAYRQLARASRSTSRTPRAAGPRQPRRRRSRRSRRLSQRPERACARDVD